MRGLRALIYCATALLALHLVLAIVTSEDSATVDLYLYNAIPLIATIAILTSPRFNSAMEIALLMAAFLLWTAGSAITSYEKFYGSPTFLPNIAYSLFYPCMFLAIPRTILNKTRLTTVEVIDSAIVGLGIVAITSSLIASLFLPHQWRSDSEAFFSIFNIVGDLALVAFTISLQLKQRWSPRIAIFFLGISIFTATDLLYFWQLLHGSYTFGQIADDGWLVGLLLIATSLWLTPSDEASRDVLTPSLIALNVTGCVALLALISIRPHLLPRVIIIPTVATLFLAFIRMAIALRDARSLGHEKVLARTDELTGLANRRRLITELAHFSTTEGALLLLDLDGFKPINDEYGHEIGDRVLHHVAQRFQRILPPGALLARLGGDEFGALVPGSAESTLEIALALRATLSYPFEIDGKSITVGVSIGHVLTDGNGSLLQRADAAMYEAKRSGAGIASAKPAL